MRRTIIRFLIERLVRRTWFGQFDELCFVLNWLILRCKLRPELASQYTLIISHRVIQLNTMSFLIRETAAPPTSQQICQFPLSNVSTPSSVFIFISSSSTGELSLLSTNQRQGSSNSANIPPEHVELNVLDPVLNSQFDEYSELGSRSKSSPN